MNYDLHKTDSSVRLTVARHFDATPEEVFDAWLDPEGVAHWLFATPDGVMKTVELDPRVGGGFLIAEQRGDELVEHIGTYVEINKPNKLVFTFKVLPHDVTSLVTIEMRAFSGGCELTLTHEMDAKWVEYEERTQEGWDKILEHLASELNSKALIINRVVSAPRELVFKTWTDPEHLKHWWGPKGFEWTKCSLDLRPGGVFHYCLRSPSGDDMWGKFSYREIMEPERLVYVVFFSDEQGNITRHPLSQTWPLEVLNTLTLYEEDRKTALTLRGIPINATKEEHKTFVEARMQVQQGFDATFEQLKAYLKTL